MIDNYSCLIDCSKWSLNSDKILTYKIRSNRFLHHMVRMLVGTMLEVSRGRIDINYFTNLFNIDSDNKKIFTAPSKGLYLLKVYYE